MANSTQPSPDHGSRPGVLGDETEEQNLGQPGNPEARITEEEVEEAFGEAEDADAAREPS